MDESTFLERIKSLSLSQVEIKTPLLDIAPDPLVYMVLGKDEVLYVGMSRVGLSRVFHSRHDVLRKIKKEIESIVIFRTETISKAQKLERMMILEFKPKHNGRQNGSNYYVKGKNGKTLVPAKIINEYLSDAAYFTQDQP
jgi:excinuclease UvrABC nuclease subunit